MSLSKILVGGAIVVIAAVAMGYSTTPSVPVPEYTKIQDEQNQDITLITEVDGVKLWRVYDRNRYEYVYFTSNGDTKYDVKRGKSRYSEEVPGQPN